MILESKYLNGFKYDDLEISNGYICTDLTSREFDYATIKKHLKFYSEKEQYLISIYSCIIHKDLINAIKEYYVYNKRKAILVDFLND